MKNGNIRNLTVTAMLAAMSSVLMFFSFSVPFMPSFIKMDFSELPALIASFAIGPLSGAAVCLVKNLVNLFFTTTGGIGELSNFLLGVFFVVPAGIIYKIKKDRLGAFIGSIVGAAAMAGLSVASNYFIVYPIYTKFMPLEAIIEAYQAIFSGVTSLLDCLIIFNMPFTFLKALCSVAITFLMYKHISAIIKGTR